MRHFALGVLAGLLAAFSVVVPAYYALDAA